MPKTPNPLMPDKTLRQGKPESSSVLEAHLDHDPLKSFFDNLPQARGLDLGHYDVKEVLGRGGFGIVVKAFDRKLHRDVAIKMMNADMAATSPARKRFLREARAGAAVRHENVVQIYTVEEEPSPYLVMEFVPGESLQQRMDRTGPLEPKEVVRIGAAIARGLAAAHEQKLVHRDIKPANILLKADSDNPVRITDFGLARAADDASLSQSGLVAGTPMYMAPEQARGVDFDHRADLFSLGSVLYQMTSGRPPFRANSSVAVLKRVVEDTPRPIREIIPETPQWLADIIGKLHEKHPGNRFQSARQLAELLNECGRQLDAYGAVKDVTQYLGTVKEPKKVKSKWLVPSLAAAVPVIAFAGLYWSGVFDKKPPVAEVKPETPPPPVGTPPAHPLGLEFVKVPAGKAWLGGGPGLNGEEYRQVEEFLLGKHEITQGQWMQLMDRNPGKFHRGGEEGAAVRELTDDEIRRLPVDCVSWNDAMEFVKRLNEKHPEPGWVYRLPTGQEWEYACRGGPMNNFEQGLFDYYFDKPVNEATPAKLNYAESRLGRTQVVGSYPPNRLGLYDMHGNVFEFISGFEEGSDLRHFRGGCWHDHGRIGIARNVGVVNANSNYNGGGLRIVKARVP